MLLLSEVHDIKWIPCWKICTDRWPWFLSFRPWFQMLIFKSQKSVCLWDHLSHYRFPWALRSSGRPSDEVTWVRKSLLCAPNLGKPLGRKLHLIPTVSTSTSFSTLATQLRDIIFAFIVILLTICFFILEQNRILTVDCVEHSSDYKGRIQLNYGSIRM